MFTMLYNVLYVIFTLTVWCRRVCVSASDILCAACVFRFKRCYVDLSKRYIVSFVHSCSVIIVTNIIKG